MNKSELLRQHGTIAAAARAMGVPRKTLADRLDREATEITLANLPVKQGYRNILDNIVGHVVVFSDAHFWPGERPVAYKAMLRLIDILEPVAIINNGDAFDGARISRHPPTGWVDLPTVEGELNACIDLLEEIERKGVKNLYWNAGNHDSRFSIRLAQQAPEFTGVHGTDLKHHFPGWQFGWSTCINNNTMVKHRWHGGTHATFNNVVKSGMNIVTGHLHSLRVTPFSDYNGRRWGVDSGTLSDLSVGHDKFTWAEDNPVNWGSGFAVLTFDEGGDLLPPELCEVIRGRAYFRGRVV